MTYRLLLLVWVLSVAGAVAGTTGKITGKVTDASTGEALIGASVVIEGTSMGAAANVDGYYVILNVPPGEYSIVVSAVGYTREVTRGVKVSVDLTTNLDVKLNSIVVVGQEVVVTAERPLIRKDLTSSQARIDADQIQKLAVREMSEVLTLQAGVTEDRFGGIHIRGGRTNEVGYWVDGISVSDVYDGSQAVQVDNNAIQELQVISGTFNAEYGQAMSGIVNIVTKDGGASLHGSLSSYLGDYLTSDAIYFNLGKVKPLNTRNIDGSLSGPSMILPDLTFYVSGRYFRTDGWLFGDRTFYPDGVLAPGADSIKDAAGNLIGMSKPDNPVPMNPSERWYGQAKLTYQFSPTIKLSLTGIGSRNDFQNYNHDWAIVPDGNVRDYDRGYNVSALWTHTLSGTSFYTVNLSYFRKDFKEYLYENPLDPRYIVDPTVYNRNLYEYYRMGTNNHQFKRNTETRAAKIDYTNQLSSLHEIKIGFEGRLHRLYLEDYYVTPLQVTTQVSGATQSYYTPSIPPYTSPQYQEYSQAPVELSGYVQDKLEYQRMIVNIGLRFDYFNSRGLILTDPQDPNVYLPQKAENQALTLDQRLSKWYARASKKYSFSPRFGISYPITDRGVLHFSYGHFLQIPSFEFLYQNPGYKVDGVTPVQGVYGNPDLKPQRTAMYEFGLQQQLSSDVSFDVTGFYKDTRDWVSTSAGIPVRDPTGQTSTVEYTIFINKDYANTRGITLTFSKRPSSMWTMNFSYTYQTVEGINSSPDEEQAAIVSNNQPTLILTPLDWDQTHTLNLSVGFGPEDWGIFLLGRYNSGLPYTPVINQAESHGEDVARVVTKNSRRQPDELAVDLRAFKDFQIGALRLGAFVKVFNLFDRRNASSVYGQTGLPTATVQQIGASGVGGIGRVNSVEDFLVRPDFYTEPRQIQVGMELNF